LRLKINIELPPHAPLRRRSRLPHPNLHFSPSPSIQRSPKTHPRI